MIAMYCDVCWQCAVVMFPLGVCALRTWWKHRAANPNTFRSLRAFAADTFIFWWRLRLPGTALLYGIDYYTLQRYVSCQLMLLQISLHIFTNITYHPQQQQLFVHIYIYMYCSEKIV